MTKDEPIEIRCAIAKLEAADGKVNADPLVLDTSDTKITGSGKVRCVAPTYQAPHGSSD